MSKKAQVGLEYIMIFGFAMMVILPFSYYFFLYSQGPAQQSNMDQAYIVARRIVDNAETVYSLGEGAHTTFRAYLPNNVMNGYVADNVVVFEVALGGGVLTNVMFSSGISINGTVPDRSGLYNIRAEAFEDYVNLSYS